MKPDLKNVYSLHLLAEARLPIILGTSLMMVMGSNLVYPILPVIRDALHIPKAQIGLVISAFTFPTVFTAPLAGFIADFRGRKWIMASGLFLYGLAGLAIGLAGSFKLLLLLRAVQGVGYSAVMPLVVVLIGDSFIREQEAAAQGMKVFVDRLGLFIFPPLAGLLGALAWQAPFILYGLAIPLALGVLHWIPEPEFSRHSRILPYIKDVFTLIRSLNLLAIFSMSSLRFFLEVGFFTYLPVFAAETLHVGIAKGGFLFTIFAIGAMVTSSQIGVFAGRCKRLHLVILAFFIQALCLMTVPLTGRLYVIGIVMFFFGLANGIISPAQKSLLTQSAPGNLRGGVVSADRVLQNLMKTVSPLIAGLLLTLNSVANVFFFLGAVALAWVLAAAVLQALGHLQYEKGLAAAAESIGMLEKG